MDGRRERDTQRKKESVLLYEFGVCVCVCVYVCVLYSARKRGRAREKGQGGREGGREGARALIFSKPGIPFIFDSTSSIFSSFGALLLPFDCAPFVLFFGAR
jgi:hypothetical protein